MKVYLSLVKKEEKDILYRLLQYSLFEESESDLNEMNEDAIFEYKYFDAYFTDDERYAYFIREKESDKLLGFAMINQYTQKFENGHSIAEYLVIPKYRRNKIGKNVAFEIFNKFQGNWEISPSYNNDCLEITSYRKHQNYDMVTFSGLTSIEDVVIYKGDSVYVNRSDYDFGILNQDLIGLDVYGIDFIGKVDSIINNNAHELIVVTNEDKTHYVPYIDEFIEKIDLENKRIDIKEIEGLINEN